MILSLWCNNNNNILCSRKKRHFTRDELIDVIALNTSGTALWKYKNLIKLLNTIYVCKNRTRHDGFVAHFNPRNRLFACFSDFPNEAKLCKDFFFRLTGFFFFFWSWIVAYAVSVLSKKSIDYVFFNIIFSEVFDDIV